MLHHYDLYANLLLILLLAAATLWPRMGERYFGAIESAGSRLGAHRAASICTLALLLVTLRLASWPSDGLPIPYIHDEFSYLLAGDTFAHGRLANPAHPLWVFFETFHVNMQPAYISKYPPAQGVLLAAGQMLGNPWIGVLLSVAAMCATITWMLQGWMPARWALLGGALAAMRFYAYNDWVDSYWGGAAAAIGGALALGAMPRIWRRPTARDGILLGAGIAILANSRPYEGIWFCLPLAAALLWWFVRGRRAQAPAARWRVVAAAGGVLILCGAFMAYYNWRGTGSALLFPYTVNDRTYLSTPHFSWQEMGPPRHYQNAQFDDFYNGWCRKNWGEGRIAPTLAGIAGAAWNRFESLREFYLPAALFIPLLAALPWLLRNQKARFMLLVCASTALGLLPVVWFQPHYAAPMTAAVLGTSAMGLRYLRTCVWRRKPFGLGWSRAFVLAQVLPVAASLAGIGVEYRIPHPVPTWARTRQHIEAQLEAMPGGHLVLIRYGPQHNSAEEWVANRADIDRAKVVWAREIPGEDLKPLVEYFHGRQLWRVEPDSSRVTLEPGSGHPQP